MFTHQQKQWIQEHLWNIHFYTYALDLTRSAYMPLGNGSYQDLYKKILIDRSHQELFQNVGTQHPYDLICSNPDLLQLAPIEAIAAIFFDNIGYILPLPEQSKCGKKTILLGDLDIDAITQNVSLQKTLLLHCSFFLKFFGFSLTAMDPSDRPSTNSPEFSWDPQSSMLLKSEERLISFCQIITRMLRLLFLVGLNNYAAIILTAVSGESALLSDEIMARISPISHEFWSSAGDWAAEYNAQKSLSSPYFVNALDVKKMHEVRVSRETHFYLDIYTKAFNVSSNSEVYEAFFAARETKHPLDVFLENQDFFTREQLDTRYLEHDHSFIQVLMPKMEVSAAVKDAPVFTEKDIAAIVQNEALQKTLLFNFILMARFYGYKVTITPRGNLPKDWQIALVQDPGLDTASYLRDHPHNYLRITRMLTSLKTCGFSHAAEKFHEMLEPLDVAKKSKEIWAEAMRPVAEFEKALSEVSVSRQVGVLFWEKTLVLASKKAAVTNMLSILAVENFGGILFDGEEKLSMLREAARAYLSAENPEIMTDHTFRNFLFEKVLQYSPGQGSFAKPSDREGFLMVTAGASLPSMLPA
jgi:hypothetical protein